MSSASSRASASLTSASRPGPSHRPRRARATARGNQRDHDVLARYRVIEDRGVQRAALFALDRTGLGDDFANHFKDPRRTLAVREPAAPMGQRRGMEPGRVDRVATRRLPPQVERDRASNFTIRQSCAGSATRSPTRPPRAGSRVGRVQRGNRSANIPAGNYRSRCSAKNANTLAPFFSRLLQGRVPAITPPGR
jgi:hypothetical protein